MEEVAGTARLQDATLPLFRTCCCLGSASGSFGKRSVTALRKSFWRLQTAWRDAAEERKVSGLEGIPRLPGAEEDAGDFF
jgi:hypothetical protein